MKFNCHFVRCRDAQIPAVSGPENKNILLTLKIIIGNKVGNHSSEPYWIVLLPNLYSIQKQITLEKNIQKK